MARASLAAARVASASAVLGPTDDARLASLAASRGALRRALAAVARAVVATRSWERLGFARLRDYAIERVGLSAREIQDLAHVDEALGRLPRTSAALVDGRLRWTQARLLARVATPDDEEAWLEYARGATTRALAREVRAVDRGSLEHGALDTDEEGAPAVPRETLQLRCSPAVRARWWNVRTLARRVAGESLPVWECMEAVAAEVASSLPLDRPAAESLAALPDEPLSLAPRPPANTCATQGRPSAPPANACATQGRSSAPPANACATQARRGRPTTAAPSGDIARPGLSPFLAPLVAGLGDADAFELDARLCRAVALEQRLEAELAPLLLRVTRRRGHRAAGFASIDHYARERLGCSPRKARMLLRLQRACERSPALGEAWREGRLSWVKAHALVPIATEAPGHIEPWVEHAAATTVRALEDDLEQALQRAAAAGEGVAPAPPAEHPGRPDPSEPPEPPERQTGAKPTPPDAEPVESARVFWSAPRASARLFRAVLCTVRRALERSTGRLPTEGQAFAAMLEHAASTWAPPELRTPASHRIFERDGWRCAVPGCSAYRNLHDHHIVFRSAGGSDAPENRVALCAWHHLRGVHAGRVRCTGRAPDRLRFELGLRAGRPALLDFASEARRPMLPPCPQPSSSPRSSPRRCAMRSGAASSSW